MPNGILFFGTREAANARLSLNYAPRYRPRVTAFLLCPAVPTQILGLGVDQIVYAPAGEDAFLALCYALDLIGQVLEGGSKSLNLQNRDKTGVTEDSLVLNLSGARPPSRLFPCPETNRAD